MALHLGDIEFIRLMLQYPEGHQRILFNLCFVLEPETKRKFIQKSPSAYPVKKMLSLILDHAKLDVNAKDVCKLDGARPANDKGETAMHLFASNAPAAFGRFMVENAEKYGIDLYAKDANGKTPFEAMLNSSYDQNNIGKRLDYWFKHNPDLLTFDVFKQMKESKLRSILIHMYNQKVENGECTKSIDKNLYSKNPNKKLTHQFIMKKGIKRGVLENVIWQVYQDKFKFKVVQDEDLHRLEDMESPTAKRRKNCFLM